MGFEVSKESIRKHLISEGFKSLAPIKSYELTNEQNKEELNYAKRNKILIWIVLFLQTKLFSDETRRNKEDGWKKEAKI